MSRVIWTAEAASSLRQTCHFLAAKDSTLATRALRTIHAQANVLVLHPRLGHPVDGAIPPRLEWQIRFGSSDYVLHYWLLTAILSCWRSGISVKKAEYHRQSIARVEWAVFTIWVFLKGASGAAVRRSEAVKSVLENWP